jgi:hypothetical protein
MKTILCIALLVSAASTAAADVSITDNDQKVTVDCAKDKVVNVVGNKAVITLTGTCEQVNISGNKATVKGSAARVQVSGNENKLALDAADAILVSGNKNIVSCKKGLRDAPPRVMNSGTDNKVSVEK